MAVESMVPFITKRGVSMLVDPNMIGVIAIEEDGDVSFQLSFHEEGQVYRLAYSEWEVFRERTGLPRFETKESRAKANETTETGRMVDVD